MTKGRPLRILFVHEVNYVNKVIFEMHEFPELLALRGHDVGFFHFPETPDKPTKSLKTRRSRIAGRVHPEAEIELITPPTFGGGSWERYIAPLLNLPALRREIRRGAYDVIVLYAVPTTGWQTVLIAKRLGVPVVFRALDVSHKIRANLLAPLIRAAEQYIYRNADVLSANNPAMAEYCVELSKRNGPTEVHVPPIDLSHFEEVVNADLHAQLNLTVDNRIVLYMGSFFSFSGLDTVVKGMVEQFQKHPELRLVLVGGGEIDAMLRSMVDRLGITDKVIFTGLVPYSRLPEYLKLADVAINPFRQELLTHVALPHKVLQYMAAGVASVSTSLDGLRGVLGEGSGVIWAETSEDVARVATELAMSDRSTLRAIAATQKKRIEERFSKEAAVDAFEETLMRLG